MIYDKLLRSITAQDIQSLVDEGVEEDKRLDFKKALAFTDNDKRELAEDVIAFANTAGGVIIVGLDEVAPTQPNKNTGIAGTIVGPILDESSRADFQSRVTQLLRERIEPKLVPHETIRFVQVGVSHMVAIIHVPKSWNGPHMLKERNSRFFTRTVTGKQPMDYLEIKSAFLGSLAVPEQMRNFVENRVALIQKATSIEVSTYPKLTAGSRAILHFLPTGSFQGFKLSDMKSVLEHFEDVVTRGFIPYESRYSADGINKYGNDDQNSRERRRNFIVFRNGCIEATRELKEQDIKNVTRVMGFDDCQAAINAVLKFYGSQNVPFPIFIFISIVNAKNKTVWTRDTDSEIAQIIFQSNTITLPEVMVPEETSDASPACKEILDGVWQASGFRRYHA